MQENARKRSIGARGVVAGSTCVALAAFLPWARSGTVDRSSFALVGVADRLDVLPPAAAVVARLWFLAPAAAAAALAAAVVGRQRLALGLGTVVAGAGVAFAMAVRSSPFLPRGGVSATLVGGAVTALGWMLQAVGRRRQGAT